VYDQQKRPVFLHWAYFKKSKTLKPKIRMNIEQHTPWIPELYNIWQIKNPHYPADVELDYPAIRKIGEFIAKQARQQLQEPLDKEVWDNILQKFKKIAMFVSKDKFFRKYSLDKIAKFHLQEAYMQAISHNDSPPEKKVVI
jgi:hypothetical protein